MKLENEKISEELGDAGRGHDDRGRGPVRASADTRSHQYDERRVSC